MNVSVDVLVMRECHETISLEVDEIDIAAHFELDDPEDITPMHVHEWLEEDIWADIPSGLHDIHEVQSIIVEAVEI